MLGIDWDVLPPPALRRKRTLPTSQDSTEDLVENIKKCRVSATPGELRLKRDLLDCDVLLREGIARLDKTVGNPLRISLTFLCPMRTQVGNPANDRGGGVVGGTSQLAVKEGTQLPTQFSIVVPKFYPHEPPMLYADRCFSRTCSFVREDGQLQLPFLTSDAWSSISTIFFIVQSLLQGLQHCVIGLPQPWETCPQQRSRDQSSDRGQERPKHAHINEDDYINNHGGDQRLGENANIDIDMEDEGSRGGHLVC